LKIIEDCAHSTGAIFKGKKVGTYGDVGFYSCEQSKIFNTIQGGIAVTDNPQFAARLRDYLIRAPLPDARWIDRQLYSILLNYYQYKHPYRWWRGDLEVLLHGTKRLISTTSDEENGILPTTYGRRMPNPVAAIGLNQLKKIDHYNKLRRINAKLWDSWCEQHGYGRPYVDDRSTPVYLRYPVMMEAAKKEDISWALRDLGIELGVWFVSHLHPSNQNLHGCPNADNAVRFCVNFPTLF
jgi:perosamine synthetase